MSKKSQKKRRQHSAAQRKAAQQASRRKRAQSIKAAGDHTGSPATGGSTASLSEETSGRPESWRNAADSRIGNDAGGRLSGNAGTGVADSASPGSGESHPARVTSMGPSPQGSPLTAWTRNEAAGGLVMLLAALVALIWANSPWRDAYHAISALTIGPASLNLDLTLATWASDGVLAVFFFVVGLELKRELTVGSLSNPRQAAVPMIAAVGGMIVPALIFVSLLLALGQPAALQGWAIPTATDIAFALGVLAIFGRGLPRGLRAFLLTLAVVDDLLAIIIIAAFYSHGIQWGYLLAAVVFIALFAFAVRFRKVHILLLVMLAAGAWLFMHESGVHATIAGVALGLTVPAKPLHDDERSRAGATAHVLEPLSTGIVLPVFAFFAAGVTIAGTGGSLLSSPVFFTVAIALVAGKFVGVLGATAAATKLTALHLPSGIQLRDLVPLGFLTGMGFTVSLLIAELSFEDAGTLAAAKLGVLVGTLVAASLGAVALRYDAGRQ